MSEENFGSVYHNEGLLEDLREIKKDMAKAKVQKSQGVLKSLNENYFRLLEAKIKAQFGGYSGGDFYGDYDGGDGCDCGGDCSCGGDCGGDCD